LAFDDLVQAKVRALNVKGWSDYSEPNSDGFRIQVAPLLMNQAERSELTNPHEIFVSWQPISSPDNGNSAVLSYSLEYDSGTEGESW